MNVTDMRKYVEATLEKLTPAKAQQLAKSVVHGGPKEQVQKVAQELMDRSNRNRERVMEMIRREVRSQLKTLGVATREEVDTLRRRVRELERGAGAKRSTAKRAPAKTATAKRRPAKRSTAKRSTAGQGGATSSGPAGASA